MRVFVFLHVLTMFAAVAMGYGSLLLVRIAARSDDVAALRGVVAAVQQLNPVIGRTFAVGVLLGIVAIFTNGFNPLAPWLLIAYVLVAAGIVSANVVIDPLLKRLSDATRAPQDDLERARATLSDSRTRVLLALDTLIVVAIIADMILKPFS